MSHPLLRCLVFLAGLFVGDTPAPAAIRVLIIDGQNNHDWPTASTWLKRFLVDSGRCRVEISTTPPKGAPAADWASWRPDFTAYDVVLSNFNSGYLPGAERWPREVERAFESYVRNGGGFVSFHAANNAFREWPAYNDMVGLLWRDKDFGPSIIIDAHGHVVVVPTGQGRQPGHPPRRDIVMATTPVDHPITRGFPPRWLHPSEQLTHGQHGPAAVVTGGALTILTYAHDDELNENEPMDWVRTYGKGRVYVTMLGHTWKGEPNPNLECVGFQTLLLRGIEWAATGHVSTPVPPDFPKATEISLRRLH